jgi:glycine/D-amino acid oxidase-like deaminating enzyme
MAAPKFVEGEVRVVGNRWSPRVHAIKDFLARSRVPYRWLDPETDSQARGLLERAGTGDENIPLVLLPDGSMLVNPDVHTVAEKLGLDTEPDSKFWDLIVVGGGPAGVTASIYAASDGLRTVVVEQGVPGGQISYSGAVENYPGFPEALSGSELTRRAVQQAERFGVEIVVTRRAEKLRIDGSQLLVGLEDGSELAAHTVLLAMGVSFRWLDAPGCSPLVGAGIYYGAATAEASACTAQEIYARRGQLRGSGSPPSRAVRPQGDHHRARGNSRGDDVEVSHRSDTKCEKHRGEDWSHRRWGRGSAAPGADHDQERQDRRNGDSPGGRTLRLHRRHAAHRLAGRRR